MARKPSSAPPLEKALTPAETRSGIERLKKRIEDLERFDPASVQKRWDPEAQALQVAIEETLADVFGHGTPAFTRYHYAARLDNGPVVMRTDFGGYGADPDERMEAQQYLAEGKAASLGLLRQAIRGLEEKLSFESTSASTASGAVATSARAAPPRKVFIVHGRDDGTKETVARFVEKLGLEAIILHERPNKGRTIITKFREESEGAGFAIVLMTPDDLGKAADAPDLRSRARQNVVFELGFFIGALQPARVAAMIKGDIERPSDLDGVVYISFDTDWRTALAKELWAAKFEIDLNRAMT
jgi:predicted nucleotide-binding protein